MDFKSMQASLCVLSFVLFAFNPGLTLNSTEERGYVMTTVTSIAIDSSAKGTTLTRTQKIPAVKNKKITRTLKEIERGITSLLNYPISYETIKKERSMTRTKYDVGEHRNRKETSTAQMQKFLKAADSVIAFNNSATVPEIRAKIRRWSTMPREKRSVIRTKAEESTKMANNMATSDKKEKRKDLLNSPTEKALDLVPLTPKMNNETVPKLRSVITIKSLKQALQTNETANEKEEQAKNSFQGISPDNLTTATVIPMLSSWLLSTQTASDFPAKVRELQVIAGVIHKQNFYSNNNVGESSFGSLIKENVDGTRTEISSTSKSFQNHKLEQNSNYILDSPFFNKTSKHHNFASVALDTLYAKPSNEPILNDCSENGCVEAVNEYRNNWKVLKKKKTSSPNVVFGSESTLLTSLPKKSLNSSVNVFQVSTHSPPVMIAPTTPSLTLNQRTTGLRFLLTPSKPPPIVDDYRTIKSQSGTHAYLPCNVKQFVKKPISWLRVRDGHILTVDQTTFIADQRFQSIHSVNPERWSLQIKYVLPKDAGTYECQVSTEPKSSAIVNLQVLEAKTELVDGSTRHVKAGSQVKLRCIISQALEPPLFINWFYNQKQIYLHNHKGWRTEIERIDLPQNVVKTTTTTAKRPSAITTTANTENDNKTTPSTESPLLSTITVEEGKAGAFSDDGIVSMNSLSSSPPTMSLRKRMGVLGAYFTSSGIFDGADIASSTTSTMFTLPPAALQTLLSTTSPSSLSITTSAKGEKIFKASMTTTFPTVAIGAADIKQITAASLIIASVGKEDSGNYTCSPSNSEPRTIMLHVLNGEYSASAITSGSSSYMPPNHRTFTTTILILLWFIKYCVEKHLRRTRIHEDKVKRMIKFQLTIFMK